MSAREAYDQTAAAYDETYRKRSDAAENRHLADVLHALRADQGSVLDVGCGTGLVADLLPKLMTGDYVGVDPSAGMLKVAMEKHPGQVFIQGSLDAIPLHAERFSVVTCLWALGYMESPLRAAHELLSRVDRRGKLLVVTYMEAPRVNGFYASPSRVLTKAGITVPVTPLNQLDLRMLFAEHMTWSRSICFGIDGRHAILFGQGRG